jgi:hypothetical protein
MPGIGALPVFLIVGILALVRRYMARATVRAVVVARGGPFAAPSAIAPRTPIEVPEPRHGGLLDSVSGGGLGWLADAHVRADERYELVEGGNPLVGDFIVDKVELAFVECGRLQRD